MTEPVAPSSIIPFDTRAELERHMRALLARAHGRLDLFDPDVEVFGLGAVDVELQLRAFVRAGGLLRLALHETAHLERHAPRFLRLLRDYSDRVACRQTPRSLRHLTDSFALADNVHVVRRFHSDHMRGEAAFDAPAEAQLPAQRFIGLWEASLPTLSATVTGM